MTLTPVTISTLQSYNPYIDPRNTNQPAVISGRNFAWDARGPYSAFSTRLLSGSDVIDTAPHVTQGLALTDDIHFVATLDKIRKWGEITGWSDVLDLVIPASPYSIPLNDMRWSAAYLAAGSYVCSKLHGFFKLEAGPTLTVKTPADIPGLPAAPISICESNGRLIIMDSTWVYWSGPNAPEDLVPSIGGAGGQSISARVAGIPLLVTSIPIGFIVWTTQGALIGEFIGGSNVFRFYPMNTRVLPISAFGVEQLPDGSYALLTRTGIFQMVNGGQPAPLTPKFNEFLRELFRVDDALTGTIYFSLDENKLYVCLRDSNAVFSTTYVCDVALDKWGLFSSEHLGIFKYTTGRGAVGFTDRDGVGHRFLSYMIHGRDRELASAPGTYIGLDSFIEVGFIRPENVVYSGDSTVELQDLLVTRDDFTVSISNVDEGSLLNAATSSIDMGLLTTLVTTSFDESPEQTLLGLASYGVIIKGDTFALDADGSYEIIPELVQQGKSNDLWTGMASGEYISTRFTAENSGEYFHIVALKATVSFNGRLA